MTGLFYGTGTAIITPFRMGKVDMPAFERLVKRQLSAKIDALIVCGTTGEASTLAENEKIELTACAKDIVKGKIPVIAGAGANSTEKAVQNARAMEKAGADAILCVTPYYNMCSQEGLKAHFTSVADAVSLPVILYNVPSRTGVSLEAETASELFKHPRIPAVKEAAGDFIKAMRMTNLSMDGAYVYSGNDNMTVSLMALGASGVISVVSNAAPGQMREITDACLSNDFKAAREKNAALQPLMDQMKKDVNPIVIKAALSILGLVQNELRLPLTPLSGEKMKALEKVIKNMPDLRA
ncbi:MAG: 4-hydroxy-tetrahydrodipicolinate synthase [Clostridia bacterium]|nr:4-hydroxy-tetrahydrodipicolinate synthase [Clostridia bacterium]